MRAALLALVLAAAGTAARNADVLGVVGDVAINKMSYKDKDTETEICFAAEVSVPKDNKIELVVTSGGERYSYTVKSKTDQAVECVSFLETVKPKSGEVEYLVGFMDGTPAQQTDVVKFIFTELPTEDTFSCGAGNNFKRKPEGSLGCDHANPPDSGYCYEAVSSQRAAGKLDKGCTEPDDVKPTHVGFQYCQPVTGDVLGDGGDVEVETLSYISDSSLVLKSETTEGSVAVVINPNQPAKFPQFIRITADLKNIPFEKFEPSADTYTTCVVVKSGDPGNTPDTVTKPATITDLFVKGGVVTLPAGGPEYYEFGFKLAGTETIYKAEAGGKSIKVNCEQLDPDNDRCFGYLEREQGLNPEELKISIFEDVNIITVDEHSLSLTFDP